MPPAASGTSLQLPLVRLARLARRVKLHSLSPTSRIRTGSAGIPAGELQFWPKTVESGNTPAGMLALPQWVALQIRELRLEPSQ